MKILSDKIKTWSYIFNNPLFEDRFKSNMYLNVKKQLDLKDILVFHIILQIEMSLDSCDVFIYNPWS